jgi:ParB/RepB/Spo0J family partition protein
MRIPPPVIEMVALDRLRPWPRNPRKGHAVEKIARSIEAFGYAAPIVAQTGTYRILAGHGRLEALKALGVSEVPVVVLDVDDDRADLYTLADNKIAESAEWDFPVMADLLLEFDSRNLDEDNPPS